MSDTHFFAATRYLSTRFDRRSGDGDLRYDEDAPGNLMDWFRHAPARVPAFPVWDLSCQIEDYFDYDLGLYLPAEWAWSHSDILGMNRELRSQEKWAEAIASALKDPTPESIRALSCCAVDREKIDPFPALWSYLNEHSGDGYAWHLISKDITQERLPAYLDLARVTLLPHGSEALVRAAPSSGDPAGTERILGEVICLLQDFPGEGVDLVEIALQSEDLWLTFAVLRMLDSHWRGVCVPEHVLELAKEAERSWEEAKVKV